MYMPGDYQTLSVSFKTASAAAWPTGTGSPARAVGDVDHELEVRVLIDHVGSRYSLHHIGEITVVFWQAGVVVCALISDLDREEVIQLAFATPCRHLENCASDSREAKQPHQRRE